VLTTTLGLLWNFTGSHLWAFRSSPCGKHGKIAMRMPKSITLPLSGYPYGNCDVVWLDLCDAMHREQKTKEG